MANFYQYTAIPNSIIKTIFFLFLFSRFNPVVTVQNQPPPPPYQQPSRTYSMNAANVLQAYAVSQQQTQQCPIHQRQPCSCTQNSTEVCQYV